MAQKSILGKIFTPKGANPDEVRMTLGEHLEELRTRLIRAIIGLAMGAAGCYCFIGYIQALLVWPVFTVYRKHGYEAEIKTFSPSEGFLTDLKVALIVGLIVSAPYSISQIWGFIAAGLYPNERKWVRAFAPTSIILFFAGALFLIIVVNPLLLDFLLTYRTDLPDLERFMPTKALIKSSEPDLLPVTPTTTGPATDAPPAADEAIRSFDQDAPPNMPQGIPWLNRTDREIRVRYGDKTYVMGHLREVGERNRVIPDMRLSEVVPFTLELAAAFGIGFQVPVVVAFLAVIGVASAAQMGSYRRHVIFVMSIAAAVITPSPDPFSMSLLLIPMIGLFEAGLLAAKAIERRRAEAAGQ